MTYHDENNFLLYNIINDRFFKRMKEEDNIEDLELIITPECNLKCEYCYLQKHKDKLYPASIVNHDKIISNMIKIFNFYKENSLHINDLDLFSGEIWQTDFGIRFLREIYEYFKNTYMLSHRITIPTNATFLIDPKFRNEMESLINDFSDIGVKLHLSFSLDGAVIENLSRPFVNINNNKMRNDDFYDLAFKFANKYNCGLHPMVSPNFIEYWIENYKWWMEKFKEYNRNPYDLMMLEVRDNDWTKEKIDKYIEFLDYVIDYSTKNSGLRKKELIKEIFGLEKYGNYNNISIFAIRDGYTCSIQRSLCIRLGDMAIVPCHRTSYDKFIAGYLNINDDYIYSVDSRNVEVFTEIYAGNPKYTQIRCSNCEYNEFCIKGCIGSQYETNNELFYPCETVCDLIIAKLNFLVNKYEKLGYFAELEKIVNEEDSTAKYKRDGRKILEFRSLVLSKGGDI